MGPEEPNNKVDIGDTANSNRQQYIMFDDYSVADTNAAQEWSGEKGRDTNTNGRCTAKCRIDLRRTIWYHTNNGQAVH